MNTFKKIIGGIIVFLFILLAIGSITYNIYQSGWYFILSVIIILFIVGVFLFGIHLLSDD